MIFLCVCLDRTTNLHLVLEFLVVGTVEGLQLEKKFVSKWTLTATENVKLKLNSKIVGSGRLDEDR